MFKDLQTLISTDNATSSRRAILIYYALVIGSIVYLAILVLGYVICLQPKVEKDTVFSVYKWMIYLGAITLGFILLMAGVITWQNVNDTINSVKGLPQAIEKTHTEIDSIKSDAMNTVTQATTTTIIPGSPPPPPEQ